MHGPNDDQRDARDFADLPARFGGDAGDEQLAEALRQALAPRPLSPRLAKRIASDLDRRMVSGRRRIVLHWSWISTAAAAVALFFAWPHLRNSGPVSGMSNVPAATALLLEWDAGTELDMALYSAAIQVDAAAADTERMSSEPSYLTWSDSDAWDRPVQSNGAMQ